MRSQPPLRIRSSSDRIPHPREDTEERIPLRIHHPTAMPLDRLQEQGVVITQHDRVLVPKLTQQPSRTLHIREQEGDRPGQKLRHRPILSGNYTKGKEGGRAMIVLWAIHVSSSTRSSSSSAP
jgi:hypothetical protein